MFPVRCALPLVTVKFVTVSLFVTVRWHSTSYGPTRLFGAHHDIVHNHAIELSLTLSISCEYAVSSKTLSNLTLQDGRTPEWARLFRGAAVLVLGNSYANCEPGERPKRACF